jgi:hypothetical protein
MSCNQDPLLQQPVLIDTACVNTYSSCTTTNGSTNQCCPTTTLYVGETACTNGSKQYICSKSQPDMSEEEKRIECCFADAETVDETCASGWCNGSALCNDFKKTFCQGRQTDIICAEYCQNHDCGSILGQSPIQDAIKQVMDSGVVKQVTTSWPYRIVLITLCVVLAIKVVILIKTITKKQ